VDWQEGMGRADGLMMPSDTGEKVVYTVGQIDGHSNPYHTTRRAYIEWNSLRPHATFPQWPHKVCDAWSCMA